MFWGDFRASVNSKTTEWFEFKSPVWEKSPQALEFRNKMSTEVADLVQKAKDVTKRKGNETTNEIEAEYQVMKLKEPGPTMRYQAIAGRARIFAGEGKGALAIAEFDRVNDLNKQPHWTMLQMARAATHETLGEPEKARACYEAVVASSTPPADSLAAAKAKLAAKR
jgi:hypothetical protein